MEQATAGTAPNTGEEFLRVGIKTLEDVASNANCGLLLVDRDGKVTYANEIARGWFDLAAGNPGKGCREVIGPYLKGGCIADKAFETGTAVRSPDFVMSLHGEERELFAAASPVMDAEGSIQRVAVVISDVTERKRAERSLRQSLRDLGQSNAEIEALLECSRMVLHEPDFGRTVRSVYERCKRLIGATCGFVLTETPEGTKGDVRLIDTGSDPVSMGAPGPMSIVELKSRIAPTGRATYENDLPSAEWAGLIPPGHPPISNQLNAPLTIDGETVGLMGLANKPGGFGEDDLRIASGFAELMALALQNSIARGRLAESEQRYRSVVGALDEGVVLWDAKGKVIACNAAAEEILGVSAGSLVGSDHSVFQWKAFREDGTPFSPEEHPSSITQRTGLPCYGVVMGICHSGQALKWVSVNSHPLTREGETTPYAVVTSFADISSHRRAEAEMSLLTKQLALLLESTHVGMFGTDLSGRCTFLNTFGASLLRCDPDDVLGKDIHQVIRPGSPDGRRPVRGACILHNVLKTGVGCQCADELFWRLDGTPIPVEVSCHPIKDAGITTGAVVSFAEISERKQAEEALRESEQRFRAIFEKAAMGITLTDNDGYIVDCNPAFSRMLGMTREELVGAHSAVFTYPSDLEEQVNLRQELMDGRRDHFQSERRYRRKDGKTICARITTSPVRGPDKEPLFWVAFIDDITERQQLEEQLLKAQRFETAGRIAGQVAHDFNNLLSPLAIYPDVIKTRLPENHPARRYCDAMLESIQMMGELNSDLLTLGRRAHTEQQAVDLGSVVKAVLERLMDVPATVRIDTQLAPNLFAVKGSASQLLRVVMNLVTNAIEAMPNGGVLTIKAENMYLDQPRGRITKIPVGEYVRLWVGDTGCGIPPEIEDKVFDAFFTTKGAHKKPGSGLGLSVVHAVVNDHRGHIDMRSEVGKGTDFFVYLPVSREPSHVEEDTSLRGGTESVILVDDDRAQREAVSELLRGLGYRVRAAESGEQALDQLRQGPADLLVLDMIMPGGIDGTETFRRARGIIPEIKAIILSGYAETERVDEARRLGAGEFVRKPATAAKLARAVRNELERAVPPRCTECRGSMM